MRVCQAQDKPAAQVLRERVLVQTDKRIGNNGIWHIAKLNGILYLPDVGSKTTSFSSAFAVCTRTPSDPRHENAVRRLPIPVWQPI